MAVTDDHHPRFLVDCLDAEAAFEKREELAERGAFDEPDECWCCGCALGVVNGRLVGTHWRGCVNEYGHLRVVA